MIEGFVLDGLPATQFPYLQCNISQLERLCTEAQTITEQLEQAKKGVAALSVFHSRLHNEQIVRSNVQSVKTTASARYALLLTDGFDLSAVPIGLFVELVSFVPIPYLKTLAGHGETLRHAAELARGRPLHAQWGTYYTFLMKVNTGWAQRFSDGQYISSSAHAVQMLTSSPDTEVQGHLAAARTQGHVPVNGRQRNDSFSNEVRSQPSAVVAGHHPLHSTADPVSSTTLQGVQTFNPDQAQTTARESMYLRVLRAKEREWGPKHLTTLDTVMELGSLYADEGRRSEAERMFSRALLGYEKVEAGNSDIQKTQEVLRKLEHVRECAV
jgi:hypothetical protein